MAEVPEAVLFWKCSLAYLSGGKVVEHLIVVLVHWLFLGDSGEEKSILFIETKSGQHPPLLPVHSFSKAAVFQESSAACVPQIFTFLNPVQPNQGIYSLNISSSVTH